MRVRGRGGERRVGRGGDTSEGRAMVGEGAAGGRRKEREGRGNRTGGRMEIEIEKGERRTAGEDGGGNERRRSKGVGEMEDGEGYAFNILRTLKLPRARFPFMT